MSSPATSRPRIRFSMQFALGAFSCLAVAFALLFSMPPHLAVPYLVLTTVAIPAALTAGAVYGSGNWRAFCIGGLFPRGLMLYVTGWIISLSLMDGPGTARNDSQWADFFMEIAMNYRTLTGLSWLITLLVGAIVVFIRESTIRPKEE